MQSAKAATLSKKTPTQVFSCKYCETFRKNVFYRTTPLAASELRCLSTDLAEKVPTQYIKSAEVYVDKAQKHNKLKRWLNCLYTTIGLRKTSVLLILFEAYLHLFLLFHVQVNRIRLSHIFKIPSISNEKPSISSIKNLGFGSTY